MQSLKQFDANYEVLEKSFDLDDSYWESWLESEGFDHIVGHWEDSHGFLNKYPAIRHSELMRTNYWYWCKHLDCFIFRIYVFRNCVVVDKDWDCGGNAGGRVYDFECWTIEEIWWQIIDYIKFNIK